MIAKQMQIAELESNVRGLQSQLEKERQRAEKKSKKLSLFSPIRRRSSLLDASVDNSGRNHGDGGAFGGAPLGLSHQAHLVQCRLVVSFMLERPTDCSKQLDNNCAASFNAG